jgi:hypothetical protein
MLLTSVQIAAFFWDLHEDGRCECDYHQAYRGIQEERAARLEEEGY